MKMYAVLEMEDNEKLCVKVTAKSTVEACNILTANYNYKRIVKITDDKENIDNLKPKGQRRGYYSRPTYRNSGSSKRFFI